MYKYKIYNKLSTSKSKIVNENDNSIVGYIKKNYANIFTRFIDLVGDGKLFNSFKLYNKDNDLIFMSKQKNPFKFRNFIINFTNKDRETITLNIIDKHWFRISEKTNFTFLNQEYELQKNIGESAIIINKKTQKKIAKWKNPVTSPVSIYFKLLDESLKEYELLFLGIFHTYLYGE
ncbi:hypothetical protein K4R64_10720 [Staphylococcus epidermidis]|nr:hypothetical protein [Staphylococcus epidermidis]MCG1655175.1 hypothetical protein [Staphylococcus epidermidis]MCG1664778.1 hypothetical protein [Staphylococcus epidermidis]MCG1707117.1 hypothetical protein [Staphylococcus epidermidis]MCG1721268.1 hypothetical protein [Staphylococcus epidermidis]